MLRVVRLKNFVKFEKDVFLKFEKDGVYFFMGENNSGKSSVFEAVRRCLDMKLNYTFAMNFPKQENSAYVVCEFLLPECEKELWTSFVYIPDCGYAKVVVKDEEVYMDIITKGDYLRQANNFQCEISTNEKLLLVSSLGELIGRKDKEPEQFLECVQGIIKRCSTVSRGAKFIKDLRTYFYTFAYRLGLIQLLRSLNVMRKENYTLTETEKILAGLSDNVVFTFAMRAVGGVQWSESSMLRKGEEFYSLATDRCEILKWFSEKDPSNAETIFKTLTSGETFSFRFYCDRGKCFLLIEDGMGHKVNILKCPEGILEARHISLLLSCKKFQTLFLEEPDRGMHPQRIQRLKNIILPEVKNKVIIIISHNSAFLSPAFIPQTFKFSKCRKKLTEAGGDVSEEYCIVNIGDAIRSEGEKTSLLLPEERYANIIFAKRVIFVEGESDFIFTSALFSHILNPKNMESTKRIFDLVSELHEELHPNSFPLDLDKLKALLVSLYITKLDGHGEKGRWHRFCEKSMTPCLFLLDNDAVLEHSTSFTEKEAKECADVIHWKIVSALEKEYKFGNQHAETIVLLLEKRFLKVYDGGIYLENDQLKQIISEKLHDETEIGKNMDELDILYQCVYTEENKQLRKAIKSAKLDILPKAEYDSFKTIVDKVKSFEDWDKARMLLRKHGIFAWKYGSIEDSFLELILTSDSFNGMQQCSMDNSQSKSKGEDNPKPQTAEKENVTERNKTSIFERYQKFVSLQIDLKVARFRKKSKKKKKTKKNKLYISDKISDEQIKESVNLVIRFCTKNSDIVHFIHFLTEYAKDHIF